MPRFPISTALKAGLPVLAIAAVASVLAAAALPGEGAAGAAAASAASRGHEAAAAPSRFLRSSDQLVDSVVLAPKGAAAPSEVVALVREHWTTLRAKGLAAAFPILILLNEQEPATIQYTFKWKDAASRAAAAADPELRELGGAIEARTTRLNQLAGSNEVYQGFDHHGFPATGGVELLRGKCNSRVKLAMGGSEMDVNVLNGFVLMHRSPGHDTDNDGNREMYVEILQHGGDVRLDLPGNSSETGPRILRVGQNEELPQYGLIRAQTTAADFPATAMWVVHWRIWTDRGTVITDPATPLVFGPTTVQHYPPVGTEFHSTTGPVKLIHEETGQVVGMLEPKELTAFDIVVTKDDEIESVALNDAPAALVKLFNERAASYRPPALH